jgi:hypothetical protein
MLLAALLPEKRDPCKRIGGCVGNYRMINEYMVRRWVQATVPSIQVLYKYLPGGTDRNHEKTKSGKTMSLEGFESGVSQFARSAFIITIALTVK